MDICNYEKNDMNIVIVGHVDHGKSTVIGRLLADTGSLPEGKLEQIREMCRRNSKPFEYAFLLDALKDERSQGITIDTARSFFKTQKREYIIIDAPGHIEFLKNMITGASRAEAALLVIDANEGIKENSRRHGYILSMLGIKQVAILVNKLDLVGYSEDVYNGVVTEYSEFLKEIGVTPKSFIPISAVEGDNIASHSDRMPWYSGNTVLEELDSFEEEPEEDGLPFRMPVQDVYKFTSGGDDRRIVAGTAETGVIRPGDQVIFWPSGKQTTVKTTEAFNTEPPAQISAGWASGFTMEEQIYVKRGELACKVGEKQPSVSDRLEVSLFWLGKNPLQKNKKYFLKIGTAKVSMTLEECIYSMNASSLEKNKADSIGRHEVAQCVLKTNRPVAFDLSSEIASTSRFVVIDDYEISGGGIVTGFRNSNTVIDSDIMMRNYKWDDSGVSDDERFARNGHRPSLILISGKTSDERKLLAREVEKQLFDSGVYSYYVSMANVLYGVGADLKNGAAVQDDDGDESVRRMAEVSYLLMGAGMVVIATADNITGNDIEIITSVTGERPSYYNIDEHPSLNASDICNKFSRGNLL